MLFLVILAICSVQYQTTDAQVANATITPQFVTHGQRSATLTCNSPVAMGNTYVWMRNTSRQLCTVGCTSTMMATALLRDNMFLSQIIAATGATLNLNGVTAAEYGGAVFDCAVISDRGTFSTSLMLQVAPGFVTQPADQIVVPGDNVTLTCQAESFPSPIYQWEKLNTSSRSYYSVMGENMAALQFNNISRSDYGSYRCRVTSGMTNLVAFSNTALVSDMPAPVMTTMTTMSMSSSGTSSPMPTSAMTSVTGSTMTPSPSVTDRTVTIDLGLVIGVPVGVVVGVALAGAVALITILVVCKLKNKKSGSVMPLMKKE